MKFSFSLAESWPKLLFGVAAIGLIAMVVDKTTSGTSGGASSIVENVSVPAKFSTTAQMGESLFNETCAACHGENAAGTEQGPPLVHDIYNPGHHPDESFMTAARFGVRAHHWQFGNMPKQEHVTMPEARAIATYVRELQAVNGIVNRAHTM